MARTKKSDGPSPDYPQGLHNVTFKDISEEEWWLIIHLFEGRIEYFQRRLNDIMQTGDPDLMDNTTQWYKESIARLTKRLTEFEDQISPVYFRRKRAEKAARCKQYNLPIDKNDLTTRR